MNEENRNQPPTNPPAQPMTPEPRPSGGMTLHPSDTFAQEMQAQAQPEPILAQPEPQFAPAEPQPQFAQPQPQPFQQPDYPAQPPVPVQQPAPQQFAAVQPEPQPQPQAQPAVAPPQFAQPTPVQQVPQPVAPQGPPGTVGSSPGGVYEPPKPKGIPKTIKIALIAAGILALLGTAAALLLTGVISFTGFKNVTFKSQRGTEYSLQYYTDYDEVRSGSGATGMISKVSRNDKFPMLLNIASSEDTGSKRFGEDCQGFKKIMEVENKNIGDTIIVCGFSIDDETQESGVYIAEFIANDMNHLVTISQDYGSIDLANDEEVRASTAKFGLTSYDEDIKKILASIKLK